MEKVRGPRASWRCAVLRVVAEGCGRLAGELLEVGRPAGVEEQAGRLAVELLEVGRAAGVVEEVRWLGRPRKHRERSGGTSAGRGRR